MTIMSSRTVKAEEKEEGGGEKEEGGRRKEEVLKCGKNKDSRALSVERRTFVIKCRA